MTYEYGRGMGTAQDDARTAFNRGTQAYDARNFTQAYDYFLEANRLVPNTPQVLRSLGSTAKAMNRCAQAIIHYRAAQAIEPLPAVHQRDYDACLASERRAATTRPIPEELQPGATTGATTGTTTKETWWTGDVSGMMDSFFNKLGIGQQAAQQAESTARETSGAATTTTGATSLHEVAPETATAPQVEVEETPWYVRFAPHMIIGGLGLGTVVTVAVIMRKR